MQRTAAPVQVLPPRAVVRRGRIASRVAWIGLSGFGVVFAVVRARLSDALDLAMTIKLQRGTHPSVDRLLGAASWPGFPPQSRLIPAAIAAILVAARLRLEAGAFVAAWSTALLATVTKGLMRRPRPVAGTDLRVVAAPLGGTSFPSGHVLTYVGVYGFLAYLVYSTVPNPLVRRVGVTGLVGLVGLVGVSRVQQGHHWFTDVLASYLLGISYVIGVASVYRRLKARQTRLPA
jgi:undecaprenyl-diphosphatase